LPLDEIVKVPGCVPVTTLEAGEIEMLLFELEKAMV
jgi:hypothetical protein